MNHDDSGFAVDQLRLFADEVVTRFDTLAFK